MPSRIANLWLLLYITWCSSILLFNTFLLPLRCCFPIMHIYYHLRCKWVLYIIMMHVIYKHNQEKSRLLGGIILKKKKRGKRTTENFSRINFIYIIFIFFFFTVDQGYRTWIVNLVRVLSGFFANSTFITDFLNKKKIF